MTTQTIEVGALARNAGRDGNWGVKIHDTNTWLNFPKQPEFQRGAKVKVQYDEKSRVVSKFKVVEDGKPSGGGGYSRAGNNGGGKGRGGYNDPEREGRIVYQHSQDMAVSAAKLILENDAEKLGAKTKTTERKAAILSLIDELTARFHRDVFEQNALKMAREIEEDLGDDSDDDDFDDEDGVDVPDDDDNLWDDD